MNDEVEEMICPITGELINATEVDKLLECYERVDSADKQLFAAKSFIRHALGELTTGSAKTRRVRGQQWQAVVEMADANWDQSILKELWNSYPKFRDEYLKIASIDVRKREYKKLLEMTGPEDLEMFKKILRSAEKPATALPRVMIEKRPATTTEEKPIEASEELF